MTLPLARASRVGFGTYRWSGTAGQVRALQAALDAGCSLVDTAPSYSRPEVRRRLGATLRPRRDSVFLVSKGGYREEGYSLDPDFLRARIEQEAEAVGSGWLDAFLLHNPEHLRDASPAADVLGPVGEAFALCEEQVCAGVIGCYGVSSNVIARPGHELGQGMVARLVDVARAVDPRHHFRVLQLPFNLVERDALAGGWVDDCRRLGLTLVGNRPLSPLGPDGPLRITDPPPPPARSSLEVLGELGRLVDVTWLAAAWEQVASSDALDLVVQLLGQRAGVPSGAGALLELVDGLVDELVAARRAELRAVAADAVDPLLERAGRDGLLPGDACEPVVRRACRGYLTSLDHVLVGMRTPEDVAALAPLMAPAGPAHHRSGSSHQPGQLVDLTGAGVDQGC